MMCQPSPGPGSRLEYCVRVAPLPLCCCSHASTCKLRGRAGEDGRSRWGELSQTPSCSMYVERWSNPVNTVFYVVYTIPFFYLDFSCIYLSTRIKLVTNHRKNGAFPLLNVAPQLATHRTLIIRIHCLSLHVFRNLVGPNQGGQ